MKELPPRYQRHRELPATAFLPGLTGGKSRSAKPPRVAAHGEDAAPRWPAEDWRQDSEYLWGVDLYNNGFFWEAHEAWEAPWRAAERAGRQRLFLQGLIQCSAACLKARLGQTIAAQRLGDRGLIRLMRVQADHSAAYMGLDLACFVPAFREFAAALRMTVSVQPPYITLANEAWT